MGNKKEYNQYLWAPEQPRVYETSPLRISGTPMSEEDVAMSLRAENLQQSLQQNPIFKSAKQRVAQQKQREKEIAASKKWLELHPEDDNDDPYTIFERGKHQAIVNGKDPSYYEKMINDGKQFTKGALTVLSLPYLGAAAAGAYGYGASLGARGLFAGQGIYGLTNKDGVRKTVNFIKSGNYGRAALSGAGDALNAAMVLPGTKFLGSAAKYGLKSTVAGDMLGQNVRNATLVTSKPLLNVGWGPKKTLKVSRAGEYDQMYFPKRWDVVNEGANPHGVWLQGKYGTPRTDLTNPGKGAKAARARNVFSTRSDKYTGTVTLDKPIVTVGEVPNRSSLSYQADNIGADGLIYNGVYDNGYNNNQVILSFRRPELTKIQLSKAERLGIPKGDRGNLSQDQLDALEDLTSYMQSFRRPKLTKTQLPEAEPTYYTYVSGNQSINTLNSNDISGAKLAFESRYPESGVIWRTPIKDQYFGDPITIIGEAPMSQDAKNVAQIMKTRFNRFNIPERDADYTLFADAQPVRNGPSGAVDKAINTPTKVFIPESAGSNYGGMYQPGIGGFIRLDPGRSKPYKFTQIHEGLSHPTDYNVKWMTPKSSPNKTVESLYEGVSFPKDLFPEEELVQLLGKDSRRWKEGRAVTWEIINDLNNKLAKQSGISSWAQAHAPEQKLWDFIDNTLKTPDDFIKYVKKFDNAYLNDYAKVLEYYKGTPNVEKYFNRIKSALKYLPVVGIPIGMQYISENNQNSVVSNTMKQGGILKRK